MRRSRIAVFGDDGLVASVIALGFEVADDAPCAVVDAGDAEALARASHLPATVPRVVIAAPQDHARLCALGLDAARIATDRSAAAIGPAISALLPQGVRSRSRVVLIAGAAGGVGTTLLATNLARRVARVIRTCVIDITGSGAAGWWCGVDLASWAELEPLASELGADHIPLVSREASADLYLIGGGGAAPSEAIVSATLRAAVSAFDVVIVDAEPVYALRDPLHTLADRVLVLSRDDAMSAAALTCPWLAEDDWLIACGPSVRQLSGRDVFRALPWDDDAVSSARSRRGAVGGRLGRAYDELAEIISVDSAA